jgi:hypothetical protein
MRSAVTDYTGGPEPVPMRIVSLTKAEMARLAKGRTLRIPCPDGTLVAVMVCSDADADKRFEAVERREAESDGGRRCGNA